MENTINFALLTAEECFANYIKCTTRQQKEEVFHVIDTLLSEAEQARFHKMHARWARKLVLNDPSNPFLYF
jgi:hypothetical protein